MTEFPYTHTHTHTHIFFIHSFSHGCLHCFYVLAVLNNIAMNMRMHIHFEILKDSQKLKWEYRRVPCTLHSVYWWWYTAISHSSFTFIKQLFSSSLLSGVRVVSSAYLRLLMFLPYLTYMQNTSCEMPSWIKHKLESRPLGETSYYFCNFKIYLLITSSEYLL